MQPADHQDALAGAVLIHGLSVRVIGATSLNGVISGSVELGEATYPWEESVENPDSATDADAYLEINIELLDAIWQKVVQTDVDHCLDLESVVNVAAEEISKALRVLIAGSAREATNDLFSSRAD
jgi:hypothetical protein